MQTKKFRLGNLLITEYNEFLYAWERHIALGEQRSGNCYVVGNILIIDQWKYQEPGYLILEFHELLARLPDWDKTQYYCYSSNLKDVTTGKRHLISKRLQQTTKSDLGLPEPIKFSDASEFSLEKYKIFVEKDVNVTWELCIADNRLDCGDCVIESGILFLKSKKETRDIHQSKKEWDDDKRLLPEWKFTEAWGHWEVLRNCTEQKDTGTSNVVFSKKKKAVETKRIQCAEEPSQPKRNGNYCSISTQILELVKLRWLGFIKQTQQTERLTHKKDFGRVMRKSVIVNDVAPFILWFILLIAAVLSIDYLLHKFQLAWIGKSFGIPGILLLVFSYVYSIKKRSAIRSGTLKSLLSYHIILTWAGTLLITIHVGIHFNAILPWLAYIAMLVVVISGLVGEYLLKDARKTLRIKYTYLLDQGYSKEQVEKKVFLDALTVNAMVKWRSVHKPISWAFGILAGFHIITILMFWGWFK